MEQDKDAASNGGTEERIGEVVAGEKDDKTGESVVPAKKKVDPNNPLLTKTGTCTIE